MNERRTRLSTSKHKRKEIKTKRSQEWRQHFAEGQQLEESLLDRVEFNGANVNCMSNAEANNANAAGGYPDRYELEEQEVRPVD